MKFKCKKNSILKEITTALDFTAQRNSLSILSNVCLILTDDTLTVKATDQKIGYSATVVVEGIESGSTTVVCDKFLNILKSLPEDEILFENIEDKLYIKPVNLNIDFQLRTVASDTFPVITVPEDNVFFSISQKDFTDMINQVIFAISDDETKFAMNGALLEKEENALVMVGTDGRRLSYIKRKFENEIPQFPKATIPTRFLELIRKLSLKEGNFEISISSGTIFIKFSNCMIFSSLIKNDFPAYKRVIPASQSRSCIINIQALSDALKRVSLFVENKYKKIILEFNENQLVISSEENEVGKGKEVLPCKYEGPNERCAINYLYLMNPIKAMEGEEVKIAFTEMGRPFTVTTEPERDYLHVIMPMNLG